MRRVIGWIFTIAMGIWWTIGQIGNAQTVAEIIAQRRGIIRGAAQALAFVISTSQSMSQWIPLALFLSGVVALFVIYFGIPSWLMNTKQGTTIPKDENDLADYQKTNRFQLRCGSDLISTNIWPGNVPVRFLHAEVSIKSGTVHACRAYLTEIKGEAKYWKGHEQLTFSPSEANDSLSKAIYADIPYELDVLVITSDGEIHVCNQGRNWSRFPRLRDLFASHGWYDLTLLIGGEDADGEKVLLRFEWTGNWQTSFLFSEDEDEEAKPGGARIRLRLSALTDEVEKKLLDISDSLGQDLPFSELADRITSGKDIPKVPEVEFGTISDCNYAFGREKWPELEKIATRLDQLNAMIGQFNAVPTVDLAKRILEESKQVIPALVNKIRARISNIL